MKILVVNDDGIGAVGIGILAKVFAGGNEVTVVAPESERSGFSHAVTIYRDMRYYKAEYELEAFAITGTPADCVKFAVLHLLDGKMPDLVLSGINSGPNLGFDIMYSGTVAAASEAAFLGIPAIAVSLGTWTRDEKYYIPAAEFVKRNLEILYRIAKESAGKAVLSVNYPCGKYNGAVFTKAGMNLYNDYYEHSAADTVQLKGNPVRHASDHEDCDVDWVAKGYAAVTPLTLDRNCYELLEKCRGIQLK